MTVASLIRILELVPNKELPVYIHNRAIPIENVEKAKHIYMAYIDRQISDNSIFVEKSDVEEGNSVLITN